MKQDYLWDKTGEDSEIEMLENTLRAFRYQETARPAVQTKVLPFKKASSGRFFRFATAAAACLTFGLFVLAAWFQILNNKTEIGGDAAEINTPQSKNLSVIQPPIEEREIAAAKFPENYSLKRSKKSEQPSAQKTFKIRSVVRGNVRRKESTMRNVGSAKTEAAFTKEERHAYERLMLALSITSSKLKIVKDKSQSLGERTAVLENGK